MEYIYKITGLLYDCCDKDYNINNIEETNFQIYTLLIIDEIKQLGVIYDKNDDVLIGKLGKIRSNKPLNCIKKSKCNQKDIFNTIIRVIIRKIQFNFQGGVLCNTRRVSLLKDWKWCNRNKKKEYKSILCLKNTQA